MTAVNNGIIINNLDHSLISTKQCLPAMNARYTHLYSIITMPANYSPANRKTETARLVQSPRTLPVQICIGARKGL